jgi:hypothetical protein
MLDTLRELIAQDSDYSQRTWNLAIRRRVLCGTIYAAYRSRSTKSATKTARISSYAIGARAPAMGSSKRWCATASRFCLAKAGSRALIDCEQGDARAACGPGERHVPERPLHRRARKAAVPIKAQPHKLQPGSVARCLMPCFRCRCPEILQQINAHRARAAPGMVLRLNSPHQIARRQALAFTDLV